MPKSQAGSRRASRARKRRARQRLKVMVAAGALALVVAVIGAVVFSSGDDDTTVVAKVELFDFGFGGDLEVPAGPIRLEAVNVGIEPHNIGIRGGSISNEVSPGGTVELEIGEVGPGTYELYCDIPGHAELGMTAPFVVTDPASNPG